ncbi:hypothetical protein [Jannaschia sp. R86511]|uniref:hypothetical protein n=1 Tax=Jannaschia sp. R86511 TaxID=3093853 RepID=UPI0036D36D1C
MSRGQDLPDEPPDDLDEGDAPVEVKQRIARSISMRAMTPVERERRRAEQAAVLAEEILKRRKNLRSLSVTRCPKKGCGSILSGLYVFDGDVVLWMEGTRTPGAVVRERLAMAELDDAAEACVNLWPEAAEQLMHEAELRAGEWLGKSGPGESSPPVAWRLETWPPTQDDLRRSSTWNMMVTCRRCQVDWSLGWPRDIMLAGLNKGEVHIDRMYPIGEAFDHSLDRYTDVILNGEEPRLDGVEDNA